MASIVYWHLKESQHLFWKETANHFPINTLRHSIGKNISRKGSKHQYFPVVRPCYLPFPNAEKEDPFLTPSKLLPEDYFLAGRQGSRSEGGRNEGFSSLLPLKFHRLFILFLKRTPCVLHLPTSQQLRKWITHRETHRNTHTHILFFFSRKSSSVCISEYNSEPWV